jgi:hypothetical protein
MSRLHQFARPACQLRGAVLGSAAIFVAAGGAVSLAQTEPKPEGGPAAGLEIRDLLERTGAGTPKLFERLDGQTTGVRFVRKVVNKADLPDLSGPHSFSDKDGVIGVCAGDYNGDERPDLSFSYPYGGHRLFRNDGTKFTDVSEETGIRGADKGFAAVWFDYDEDGDPDLYVSNDFLGPDRLYRNEGGRFEDVS